MANGLSISVEQTASAKVARSKPSKGSDRARAKSPEQAAPAAEPSILQRVAGGDQAAVNECLATYDRLVWSLARRYLRNQADAEDAVQDIFIEIWKTAGRFDPALASEVTFISMITRRRLIDRIRKNARRPALDSIDEQVGADQPAVASTLDGEAEVAIVWQVLQELEPRQQKILSLSLYEGYSHSEIAGMLDMPLGTVKTRVRRGLIYVRDKLQLVREEAGKKGR
jgi:RNA polymerase sigma-70 factor (ECF subfamily)